MNDIIEHLLSDSRGTAAATKVQQVSISDSVKVRHKVARSDVIKTVITIIIVSTFFIIRISSNVEEVSAKVDIAVSQSAADSFIRTAVAIKSIIRWLRQSSDANLAIVVLVNV